MSQIKETNIKTHTHYVFNDMDNIKNLDPNQIRIDRKSCKNIIIYYIGYITMKDLDNVNINSVNPLYLIIDIKGMDTLKTAMEINI